MNTLNHSYPLDESLKIKHQLLAMGRLKKTIGKTPLIKIDTPEQFGKIYAKCEYFNPGETVKARVAFSMLWQLLSTIPADEVNDITILEYSGGTLATCLARLCYQLQLKLVLILSETTSPAILEQLHQLDVEVHLTKKEEGFYGVMQRAKQMAKQNPQWKFLYQHTNEANINTHFDTTGKEIATQIANYNEACVDAWVASIGTGGTLIGVYKQLKLTYPNLALYATTPEEMPYGTQEKPNKKKKFAGSGGLGYGEKQPFVLPLEDIIKKHMTYSYDSTLMMMKKFYNDTQIKIGSSSAANLMAALEVAKDLGPNSVVITVFPCAGFSEEWAQILSDG